MNAEDSMTPMYQGAKMFNKWRTRCGLVLRRNLLVFLTLIGVGVGFIIGFTVAPTKPTASVLLWTGMAGELYIRMLKSMIIPLIISSVIAGTASMDPRSNGRISAVCLGYIMITNCIPAIVGTVLCLIIKPGEGLGGDINIDDADREIMETEDIFADLLRNLLPDNLVASCFQQAQTKYEYEYEKATCKDLKDNATETIRRVKGKYVGSVNSANILGLIVVSTVFGMGTSAMKEKGKPFLNFFQSTTDIIIRIMRVLICDKHLLAMVRVFGATGFVTIMMTSGFVKAEIRATPVGVASLMAKTIAGTQDLDDVFRKLGLYTATVMGGLFAWVFVVIPVTFVIVRRRNPFKFLLSIIHPIMIVFATGSTVIALPDSYYSLEIKNRIDKRISRFVAPISATIGRAGSSLYISASCMFIIQLIDLEANAANVILVIILTSVSTLAIPSVTGSSLITVLILLTALKIPGEAAAILFTLEFFMDRSRSVANLITQLIGVVVTERLCKSALSSTTKMEEERQPLDDEIELNVYSEHES